MVFILHILANAIGILIAERFVSGVSFEGNTLTLFIAGAILGFINYFIKPILKIISFPLIIISAGSFGFVLSAVILWFTARITPGFAISGMIPLFWITVIVSVINMLVSTAAKK